MRNTFSTMSTSNSLYGCLWHPQEVQGLWEGYKETYAKLEPMRQGLAMYMQEKSAGHKRKLADLQSEGERLMCDVERWAPITHTSTNC